MVGCVVYHFSLGIVVYFANLFGHPFCICVSFSLLCVLLFVLFHILTVPLLCKVYLNNVYHLLNILCDLLSISLWEQLQQGIQRAGTTVPRAVDRVAATTAAMVHTRRRTTKDSLG